MVYWVTGGVLLVYLVLVWFIGTWANPPGAGIWFLRIGLWLIGLFGAGFAAWWFHRQAKAAEGPDTEFIPSAATGEVDLLVRDAVRRLKKSALGRGASLGNLPLIFLVGDPGSTKTTTIIHSALDPELLAGHVYQDNTVVPTRVANFWYTRQAVFVDGGGSIFSQPEVWKRLIRLVQPGRVASAGKKHQAPRAAVVCFDYENFLRQGANEATLSAARRLGTRLNEVSQLLGISFPIYVLFTRADRIGARQDGGSLFLDYVAGLSKDETSQVLGATLPVRSLLATGVYAEEETRRLEKAFDELFYSLSDKRIDLLSIAGQTEKLPGIYEFPRELRKRRDLLVQFLVDLARPSQLSVNPFLRGFYFSGVRPVVIEDVASALPDMQAQDTGFNANATVVFGAGGMRAQAPVESYRASSRKVPEWVFLSQLFNEVLLKDRVALSASGFSSRVSLLRRIAFGTLAGIALVFAIGFLVSFIGNFSLERDVKQAVEDVRRIHAMPGQIPGIDQLQTLDRLKQELETLASYNRGEAHWHLRWGLYTGEDIYAPAREVYFDGFKVLLFDDAEKKLQTALLPTKAKPDPSDSYLIRYNDLRAYLITAGYGKYSTEDFMFPILYRHWGEGRNPDADTSRLVEAQFQFYSTELALQDPYRIAPDNMAVNRARDFLWGFSSIDRAYVAMKGEVSRKVPTASFSRQFRDAGDVVISPHDVEGAFTPQGFTQMQDNIAHNHIANEDWVLGKVVASQLDQATLHQQLSDRYYDDFIKEWRTVLQTSVVRSYANYKDADTKLGKLTSPSSPLLELFWFVSHNTNVQLQQITDSFQPVQTVVPAGPPDQYILPGNQAYVSGLTKVKSQISLLASSPTGAGDANLVNQTLSAVGDADGAVAQLAQKFRVDPQFHIETVTQNLLRQPLDHAQALIKMGPKDALNGAGRTFCGQFAQLTSKFPFNPGASEDVPLDQLNGIFAPNTGALWTLYSTKLAQYVGKQGSHYVANNSGSIRVTSDFLDFFNRAATLSDALYSGGQTPRVTYLLKEASTNIDGLALKIGGETLTGSQQKTFTWTGASEEILPTAKEIPLRTSLSGPWAIFRFVNDGKYTPRGMATYDLEFVQQSNGQDIVVNGKRQSYTYQLQFSGTNPLSLSYFSHLGCVPLVAH